MARTKSLTLSSKILLATRERIFATMDEQRTLFVCGRVLHMIAWPFAADDLESKEQGLLQPFGYSQGSFTSLFREFLVRFRKTVVRATLERGR